MKLEQSFVVHRPVDQVWKIFQDIPAMADCVPGATLLEDQGDGIYRGRIQSKLGPFSASFEGEAVVKQDEARKSGHVEGKGVDKRGGSRSKLVLDYRLEPVGTDTRVTVLADVILSGPIAQFGRTGLVNESANILIREFVVTLEKKLSADTGSAAMKAPELKGFSLLAKSLIAWIRHLFGLPPS
jgi:carbon monoxide dehydrogenase subunit G